MPRARIIATVMHSTTSRWRRWDSSLDFQLLTKSSSVETLKKNDFNETIFLFSEWWGQTQTKVESERRAARGFRLADGQACDLTVDEGLHLNDGHAGAGRCPPLVALGFGRNVLWLAVHWEAVQRADVGAGGGLHGGEVVLGHWHQLELRGVLLLRRLGLQLLSERGRGSLSVHQLHPFCFTVAVCDIK